MAGGALIEAFLFVQFFAIASFLAAIAAWKFFSRSKEHEGARGVVLWLGFGFACVAALFDGLTLMAGRSGSFLLVNHRRDVVLAFAVLAVALALCGRGKAKVAILATSALLLLLSRCLALSFLLQH